MLTRRHRHGCARSLLGRPSRADSGHSAVAKAIDDRRDMATHAATRNISGLARALAQHGVMSEHDAEALQTQAQTAGRHASSSRC